MRPAVEKPLTRDAHRRRADRPQAVRSPAAAAAAAGLWLLLAAVAACGDPPEATRLGASAVFPVGSVESDSPLLCVPSAEWTPGSDGGWSFRGKTEIACVVRRPPPADATLAFELVPVAADAAFRYGFEWDERALGPARAAADGGGAAIRVDLEASDLEVGTHSLRVTRQPTLADVQVSDDRFTEIAFDYSGGASAVFAPRLAARYAYLADFLLLGGAGVGEQKAGGILFVGPRELRIALDDGPRRLLTVHPENVSPREARFVVGVGSRERRLTLPVGGRGSLAVEVPAGPSQVRLAVEGDGGGVFLWGAPRLAPTAGVAAATPVVLITLDTTRRDALTPYGAAADLTPEIARFARRATVYDDAWSTAPWTLPAHASMLTGLLPSRHGAGVSATRLPRAVGSLAEILRLHGWATTGFAGGPLCALKFGIGRGFDLYHDPGSAKVSGDELTDRVLAYLDSAAGSAAMPQLLFVNYFDPHYGYRAPQRLRRRFQVAEAAATLDPAWRRIAAGDAAAFQRAARGETPVTPEARRWLRAGYLAEVAFMDEQLGRLFAALESHGLFDRALVAVVADHGEHLGEDGRLGHAYRLDPELVEVPMIVKWPHQRRGRRVAELVTGADLMPTILAAAGVAAPPVDGRALPGPEAGERSGPRRAVFSEEHLARVHPLDNPFLFVAPDLYAVQTSAGRQVLWRDGRECQRRGADGWRAVACRGDRERLYAEVVRRLGEPPAVAERGAGEMDEALRADLRALGYL